VNLLLELQDDPLRRLAANARYAREDVDVVGDDRQLKLGHGMCGGDREGQARPDLRYGHEQLEEGELLHGGEPEQRLLVLPHEMMREHRGLMALAQCGQERGAGEHPVPDAGDFQQCVVRTQMRHRAAKGTDHPMAAFGSAAAR
jgi:hypothetical protein